MDVLNKYNTKYIYINVYMIFIYDYSKIAIINKNLITIICYLNKRFHSHF